MSPRDFLDTNVLVYAFTPEGDKSRTAEALLTTRPLISVQGLNEMVNVLRRKRAFSWPEIDVVVDAVVQLCPVRPQTLGTHSLARQLAPRYGLAWWDALQLASALEAGAQSFWSEDLQHGLLVEQRLRVCNPFFLDGGNARRADPPLS